MIIDSDGRVSGCSILQSGGASLDAATCRILQSRARFEPGRDEGGKAVTSADTVKIRWMLPAREAVPVTPWNSVVTLEVGSDNQIKRCSQELSPEAPEFLNSCNSRNLVNLARLLAWRERAGDETVTIRSTARLMAVTEPRVAEPEAGKLLGHAAAELKIRPDGSLSDCTVLKPMLPTPSPNSPTCREFFRGPFAATPGSYGEADASFAVFMEMILTRVP